MNIKELADALASKELERYAAWFADDMRLFTPIHEEPSIGKQAACKILPLVFSFFDNFHYPDFFSGKQSHSLIFRAEVNGILLDGVDYLKLNDSGLITDFFVMMRPLKAITALSDLIGIAMQKTKPV